MFDLLVSALSVYAVASAMHLILAVLTDPRGAKKFLNETAESTEGPKESAVRLGKLSAGYLVYWVPVAAKSLLADYKIGAYKSLAIQAGRIAATAAATTMWYT